MELLQLRYFQAVARREHVSQAAQELHVAQPSVSRAVARLEAELGVPLFDRQGRRVRLNPFGAAFLRRVDRALGELDDARSELEDAAGLEHGNVAVAAETLLTLTTLLADFLAEHPGVSFQLYQSSAELMADQLHTGEVDLCLASQPLLDPSFSTIELVREQVLLAVPLTHPLAQRKRVNMTALAQVPFITTRPGHWLRTLADQLFTTAGIKPTIACQGDEPTAIRPLISAGLGIGLLPESSRQSTTHPPVAWLRLNTRDARRTLTLAWRTDTYLSTAAQHFRDLAVERLRTTAGDG
jgi:DNA-binding transcriptional LysR family regulator